MPTAPFYEERKYPKPEGGKPHTGKASHRQSSTGKVGIGHFEAKTGHFEAKTGHFAAKTGHFEAKIDRFEAKEAKAHFEAKTGHFEAQTGRDGKMRIPCMVSVPTFIQAVHS